MRAKKLCVPGCSLRLLLLQESHGGLMDTLGVTRHMQHSPTSSIGHECSEMWVATPVDATHATKLSLKLSPMVFTHHYLFNMHLGKT